MLVLAVSPHLDDAVLSAGGALAGLVDERVDVVVCTVFAGDPLPEVPDAARRFHAECGLGDDAVAHRRAEDLAAASVLGVRATHLPFPDAVYRWISGEPLCNRRGALFSASVHEEADVLDAVTDGVAGTVRATRPSLLLTCDAIGGHIDHRLVRLAVGRVARRHHLPVGYWADQPYAGRAGHPVSGVDAVWLARKVRAAAMYSSQLHMLWPDGGWADGVRGEAIRYRRACRYGDSHG